MATQANRGVRLNTPLGEDALLFRSLSLTDRLSEPFELQVIALSEEDDLSADDVLGQMANIQIDLASGGSRPLSGLVSDFVQQGFVHEYHEYRLTLRPWFWLLSRSADCRVFQQMSVPDIFEKVVKQYGFEDYELRFTGSYQPLEYCVQYRETDFNFLSRLLEQVGIYYFFEQHDGKHVMVLADDWTAHRTATDYESVSYYPPSAAPGTRESEHLSDWSVRKSLRTGVYSTTDYDFTAPRKSLRGSADMTQKYARSDLEIFDYPAQIEPLESDQVQELAKLRIAELQSAQFSAHGSGNVAGLATGARFELTGYPRDDLNGDYHIIASVLTMSSNAYLGGQGVAGGDEGAAIVSLEAVPLRDPYRPPRYTPKPAIHGTQTAVVVGRSGDEITTDEYGRIKVQFPWDRYGKNDENSSCWVRVAQLWAGQGWGGIHVPRIGQEVIVSFLEGDPDRPLVTGRVYNADQMPPYELPGAATQSGIKSRSTPGGGADNYNELRFEDKQGAEEVHLQAERDFTELVKNDHSVTVNNDEKITVQQNRHSDIGADETRKVGKTYLLDVGDQITIQTGGAQIVMHQNGDIEITGRNIKIDASMQVTISAGQKIDASAVEVDISGTKIEVSGTMLDLTASGVATLTGALTKINS